MHIYLYVYMYTCTYIYRLDSECTPIPTLTFDMLVDTFFLLDIVYNFNLGVIIGTAYHDDWVTTLIREIPFLFISTSAATLAQRTTTIG